MLRAASEVRSSSASASTGMALRRPTTLSHASSTSSSSSLSTSATSSSSASSRTSMYSSTASMNASLSSPSSSSSSMSSTISSRRESSSATARLSAPTTTSARHRRMTIPAHLPSYSHGPLPGPVLSSDADALSAATQPPSRPPPSRPLGRGLVAAREQQPVLASDPHVGLVGHVDGVEPRVGRVGTHQRRGVAPGQPTVAGHERQRCGGADRPHRPPDLATRREVGGPAAGVVAQARQRGARPGGGGGGAGVVRDVDVRRVRL